MFCILIPCTQVTATPSIDFEIECKDTNIEIGDVFRVEVWIKNIENIDTWMTDISFQSGITPMFVEMDTSWCNEYHYNGTIENNTITEIQSFNKNASNNDTLLFTVFFSAENNCDNHIIFQNTEAFYQGYHIDFSTTGIIVRVGSSKADNDQNNTNNNTIDNTIENTEPVANIDCSYADDSVYFNASNSTDDKAIISYTWDFDDGITGTGITVVHDYTKSGNYTVTLTVTDEEGLTDTQTMTINVTFIPEEINTDNNEEDSSWIYWIIIIIIIIILVAIFLSKYDIEI